MLTLWRRIGDTTRYRKSALLLMQDGRVLGEIIILQAHGDRFGGADVQVGLTMRGDIGIVRADALDRPVGPSLDWLVAREREFDLGTAQRLERTDGQYGGTALPFAAVGPYADPDAVPDAVDPPLDADCEDTRADRSDDGSDDCSDSDDDDGSDWGQPVAPAHVPTHQPAQVPVAPRASYLPPAAVVNTARYVYRRDDGAAQRDREAQR